MKVADLFAALRLKPDKASFEAGNKLIDGIKTGLAAFTAWKGFQWAKGTIEQVTELGGKISDLAQQVGIPAETLQQLGYAAQLSGGSMESLANSMGKLAKLANDAKKGSKEAASTFRDMGVKVTDVNGALRPAEDLLSDIADKIASMPDGTEKTALAMRAFGRSGKELIPLLNEGGAGITALREEFVALGAQLDGETASSLEEFGDQQDKVKYAIQGLKNQAVVALLPQLKALVAGFLEWVKANRLLLRQSLQRVLAGVVLVAKSLVQTMGVLIRAAQWMGKEWRFMTLMIAGLTAAIIIYKAASIGAAIASAAAWVVAAAPFIAIGAAIALVALLAEDIWTALEGGESVTGDLADFIKGLFANAVTFWIDAVQSFFDWFDQKVTNAAHTLSRLLPSWAGGYTEREKLLQDAGLPSTTTFERVNDGGADFFSSDSTRRMNESAERQRVEAATRRNVSEIPINAPITINVNGAVAADPNELARIMTMKLEGIFRTAKAALE